MNRDFSNVTYETLIATVIPIYFDPSKDFTCDAHFIFNVVGSEQLLYDIRNQPDRYERCIVPGVDPDAYRMYHANW